MTDWADEIAKAAFPDNDYSYFDNIRLVIAEELRKVDRAAELRGRASGMMEAAEIAHRLEDQFETAWRKGLKGDSHLEGMSDGASQVSDAIFESASKLSPT